MNPIGVSHEVCPGFSFPNPLIYRAAIYADENQIYGIRLQSVKGVSDIGSLEGTPVLQYFDEKSQLIGFYGTENGEHITSLGFLMHDPECVYVVPAPEPEELEPELEVVEVEIAIALVEEEGGSGVIIGVVLGLLMIIGLGVTGFFLWRRRKQRMLTTGGGTNTKVVKVAPVITKQNLDHEVKINARQKASVTLKRGEEHEMNDT